METLGANLTQAVARSLGLEPATFDQFVGKNAHTAFLRINHYPPCPSPDTKFGVGYHSDSGFLTILKQDQPGLQVYKGDGDGSIPDDPGWVGVRVIPDAYVVNAGDMLQAWTNGRFKAALHRVVANRTTPRFSAPFFLSPNYATVVSPCPELIEPGANPKYRPILWEEYRFKRYSGDIQDEGEEIQLTWYKSS
jgi:isopenicillin N synthase-like dioxygenase